MIVRCMMAIVQRIACIVRRIIGIGRRLMALIRRIIGIVRRTIELFSLIINEVCFGPMRYDEARWLCKADSFSELQPGTVYYLVAAAGSKGQIVYSDAVSRMVI
jgi:hypothetical protein